jgi:hypothetical protein
LMMASSLFSAAAEGNVNIFMGLPFRLKPLHNLVLLFGMGFLTHLRAHSLNRKNSA